MVDLDQISIHQQHLKILLEDLHIFRAYNYQIVLANHQIVYLSLEMRGFVITNSSELHRFVHL